jgi:hypothetical protein
MNGKKSKWLKNLVSTRNPVLLLLIRNKFGEQTQGMDYVKLYSAAKKLYKNGEIQKVGNWPSAKELRKMKGKEIFDAPDVIKATNPPE